MLLFSVLVFWRESPVGIVSLSMMSGGDGIPQHLARCFLYNTIAFDCFCYKSDLHLCLGHNLAGFADIVGRRYGSVKLPFNKKKSWAGSISMFISGFLLSAM